MKEIEEVCPLFEQGALVETEEDFLVFSVCTYCKCEIADAEQTEINKHSYICYCHRAYGKKCLYREKYREGGCR